MPMPISQHSKPDDLAAIIGEVSDRMLPEAAALIKRLDDAALRKRAGKSQAMLAKLRGRHSAAEARFREYINVQIGTIREVAAERAKMIMHGGPGPNPPSEAEAIRNDEIRRAVGIIRGRVGEEMSPDLAPVITQTVEALESESDGIERAEAEAALPLETRNGLTELDVGRHQIALANVQAYTPRKLLEVWQNCARVGRDEWLDLYASCAPSVMQRIVDGGTELWIRERPRAKKEDARREVAAANQLLWLMHEHRESRMPESIKVAKAVLDLHRRAFNALAGRDHRFMSSKEFARHYLDGNAAAEKSFKPVDPKQAVVRFLPMSVS